jgi:hypothetical protein
VILACKDLRHTSFQFFLPLAHLCWGPEGLRWRLVL